MGGLRVLLLVAQVLEGIAREVAIDDLFEYIETFYNREWLHETLDGVSPVRYEEQRVVP